MKKILAWQNKVALDNSALDNLSPEDESDELTLQKISYKIEDNYCLERIDKVIAELSTKLYPELLLTRSKIEKLIEDGSVRLDGAVIKNKSFKIHLEFKKEIS